jgi:hypothetical protein
VATSASRPSTPSGSPSTPSSISAARSRTRVFLAAGCDWRGAAEAHRELFGEVTPANTTLYVAGFIPDGVLVEVEIDAVLHGGNSRFPP